LQILKATLYDAKRWRDILNIISNLLDEADFEVTQEGIRLRAMDSSHTAMIDLDLPSTFFDQYECNSSTRLRVNLKSAINMLEGIGANESIEINYAEDQARLVMHLRGEYQRVFSLSTLATEGETVPQPRATFKVKAQVLTLSLKKVISDSQKVGDQISIETKADMITFRTNGLSGNVVSTFKVGEGPLGELSAGVESKATYSLDLMGVIVKDAASLSTQVNIEYSTNQVLRLDFVLPQGKLHFYLSPMLETS